DRVRCSRGLTGARLVGGRDGEGVAGAVVEPLDDTGDLTGGGADRTARIGGDRVTRDRTAPVITGRGPGDDRLGVTGDRGHPRRGPRDRDGIRIGITRMRIVVPTDRTRPVLRTRGQLRRQNQITLLLDLVRPVLPTLGI